MITARAQILIRKPVQAVFEAFENPRNMQQFWFTRRDTGLRQGETVNWFVGAHPEAFAIEVRVKTLVSPHTLEVEWGAEGDFTAVKFSFEPKDPNTTLLQVEESGFEGSEASIIERALDSTAGFNQVIIAAKAFIEYGIKMNVVADHWPPVCEK